MDGITDALIVLGMFILRLAVPMAIVLLVGYVLQRQDARWQAGAANQRVAEKAARVANPGPFVIAQLPCWVQKECDQTMRAQCPAFNLQSLPCWEARTQAEGRLPLACADCELYNSRQMEYNQLH